MRRGDIRIIDPQTGKVLALVASDADERHPRWAPDGRRLAYLSTDDSGSVAIELLAPSAGTRERIVVTAGRARALEWAPDGRRLAVLIEHDPGTARCAPIVEDERNWRTTLHVLDLHDRSMRSILDPTWHVGEAVWLRDARTLVLLATRDALEETAQSNIYMLDLHSSAARQLTDLRGPIARIRVAPDERRIAFLASRSAGPVASDLFTAAIGPAVWAWYLEFVGAAWAGG